MSFSGPILEAPVDLDGVLNFGFENKPHEPALVSLDASWTWLELEAASTRLAANYLDLGLQPGDRFASLMPNRCALEIHYLACMKAGLVATPLNYRYMAPEVDHALAVSEASIILVHAERIADLEQSERSQSLPFRRIIAEGSHTSGLSFENLLTRQSDRVVLPRIDSAASAFVFFTSGSTGSPKGVTHSRTTLGWIVASTVKGLELSADDTFLAASSLSHEGGVGFTLAALSTGARVAIAPSVAPDCVLPLLRQARPTVSWTLPVVLSQLVHEKRVRASDFESLRLVCTGGDKAPIELERQFAELAGFETHETYGMTEIGSATINPPSGINKPGSIGSLSPGYEGQIRDEEGRELSTGRPGNLWIRSECNMIGYWNNPDATAAVTKDGWLDTGDVMRFDEDGHLWFAGRKKQIIVHDGSNICPQEVEGALLEHPAVAAVGVIGIHDPLHGENVRAYVSLEQGAKHPITSELIGFARARVGYKAPEEIVFLEDIPLTPAGKTDRTALKRLAESAHAVVATN